MNDDDRIYLKDVDVLDQPTILEEEMGDELLFKKAIAKVLSQSSRYTPAHVLLKSLQSPAVTTNYDDLYEKAAESGSDDYAVPTLPWDSREMVVNRDTIKNSLLKLHGCVNRITPRRSS